jgi:hypothetical protein
MLSAVVNDLYNFSMLLVNIQTILYQVNMISVCQITVDIDDIILTFTRDNSVSRCAMCYVHNLAYCI